MIYLLGWSLGKHNLLAITGGFFQFKFLLAFLTSLLHLLQTAEVTDNTNQATDQEQTYFLVYLLKDLDVLLKKVSNDKKELNVGRFWILGKSAIYNM